MAEFQGDTARAEPPLSAPIKSTKPKASKDENAYITGQTWAVNGGLDT